jgi:hypothetical protein
MAHILQIKSNKVSSSQLENDWRKRARSLSRRELSNQDWADFRFGLRLHHEGRREDARVWRLGVKRTLASHLVRQPLDSEPIARVARKLLVEAIECWKEALEGLERSAQIEDVVAKARAGQRLFVAMRLMTGEATFGQVSA